MKEEQIMDDLEKTTETEALETIMDAPQQAAEATTVPEISPEVVQPPDVPKRLTLLEILYGMIVSPRATLRSISITKPVGTAIVTFLIIQTLSVLASSSTVSGDFGDVFGPMINQIYLYLVPIGLAIALIFWFFSAAIFQLLGEFMGGKGSGSGLFASLGFAAVPSIFSSPASLLLAGPFPSIYRFVSFAISFWVFCLYIMAIRISHRFSLSKALLTFFIPIIAFIFLTVLVIVLAIAALIQSGIPLEEWMNL
jgi:hypothetical protein